MKKIILAAVILAFTACNNGENQMTCEQARTLYLQEENDYLRGEISHEQFEQDSLKYEQFKAENCR